MDRSTFVKSAAGLGAVVVLAAGVVLFTGGGGVSMRVSPGEGPPGSNATITITGALANAPVTMTYTANPSNTGNTDVSGTVTFNEAFGGQPGDVITIEALIGNAGEQTVTGTFTITGYEDSESATGVIEGGELTEDPGAAQPAAASVNVDPDEGPTGTPGTITVTGEPNKPVTVYVGPSSRNGMTDANGKLTVQETFTGQVGDVVNIRAVIGTDDITPQEATTTFTITGLSDASYFAEFIVFLDVLGHEIPIGLPGTMTLIVRFDSITIEGPSPFVGVTGEVENDGSFVATGSGTVAGFPGIAVTFEGEVTTETLSGYYTMGAEGGLPGAEPIVYEVNGQKEETTPPSAEVQTFYDAFNTAQAAGDYAALAALLHPANLDRYGAEACDAYLESIVNPDVVVEPIAELGFGEWVWERDGESTVIPAAYSLLVRVTVGDDDPVEVEVHLGIRPDGTLGWFSDCGEPLG